MLKILESVLYILSNIFLFISFLKLVKSKEKLNLIHWIFITFILLFCYNSLIAFILSTLSIPVYLISMSICNIVIGSIMFFFNKKDRQQYFLDKKDFVATIIMIILVFVFMIVRFGIPFRIAYETCDPGIHYWTSLDFYEQSFLLNRVTDKTVVNFETRQAASYTNMGLIFKTVSPFVDEFELYNFYILFDIWMLFMASMMFYIVVSNTQSKSKFILSVIISVLYFAGYPLNNTIFGFFYSGHAVTIIATIYILVNYCNVLSFNKKISLCLLSLACFGLFFTYYFFAPVVFSAMFGYFLYKEIKTNEIKQYKKFIVKNLLVFLPACLFGFIYYILPNFGNAETSISTQINLNGYFYNNIFSNFILLVPLIVLSYIICIRKKDIKLEHFMLIMLLIFMGIILYLIFQYKAVQYYLSKNYYLLWLISFIISGKFIINNYDNRKLEFLTYGIFNLLVIFLTITNVEQKIIDIEDWWNNKTTASRIFDIYRYNYEIIRYKEPEFTLEEIDLIRNVYNMGVKDLQTNVYYGHINRKAWLSAWFRKKPITETTENKLFTFLIVNDYVDIIGVYDSLSDFDASEIDYSAVNNSSENWFLFMYNKDVENPVYDPDLDPDEIDVVIEGKEYYDQVNRDSCINCTFYDFDEGLLIYKP